MADDLNKTCNSSEIPVKTQSDVGEVVASCMSIAQFEEMFYTWLTKYQEDQASDDIDRVFRQEEAQELQAILDGMADGTKTIEDLLAFEPDFLLDLPSFNDWWDEVTAPADDGSGYAEGDPITWEDMSDEQKNAHALKRYILTGETNPWYDGMTEEQIQAAYEYLKNDGDPAVYGDQDGVDYTLNPDTANWNDIEEALLEAGYDQEFINDLLYHPENGLLHDRTNQNAVTLENILGNITGQVWDVLKLPTETDQVSRVDMDGDGVYDTVVRCYKGSVLGCSPDDYQIVYGAEIDTTDPVVQEQIQNAVIFENAKATEGWEDLEDWEKNKVLKDSGYTGPFVFGDGSTEPPLTPEQELERDYGAEAVQKATEIYNGIKDTIKGAIDDPIGTIKNILDNILPQIPEECINEGEAGVNYPEDWWKDCTKLSVLLPGLNIPLPPGMIDVNTTVRDLENAAKEVGKTLEDLFNPEDDRTIGEILSDWASDVWENIKDTWEDLEEKTDAGLINILIDMGYSILGPLIFSQIKETVIGNTNPFAFVQNCYDGDWAQQTSENQAFCDEALNEGALVRCADGSYKKTQAECAEGVFGYCSDEVTPKTDEDGTECPGYQAPFDCSSVGRKDPEDGSTAYSAADCSQECIDAENQELNAESGNCTDKDPLSTNEEDCANKGLKYDSLNDECLDECVNPEEAPTGPNGECEPTTTWTNSGPTEETCASRGKSFIPADEANQKNSECGDCLNEGWTHDGVGTNCYDPNPEPEPCPGNQQRFDGENCEEPCQFDTTIAASDANCIDPNTGTGPKEGDPCTTEEGKNGTLQPVQTLGFGPSAESTELECVEIPEEITKIECPEGTAKAGQMVDDINDCGSVQVNPCDDATYAANNPLECGEDPECNDCSCAEYAAANPEECGEVVINPCDDAVYAAENPLECGGEEETCENGATDWPLCSECPDGTATSPEVPCPGSECVDCTCAEYAAANPEECGGTEEEEEEVEGGGFGGGGFGGGGGGSGMFEPFTATISGDPQLLARREFPITDYLAGLFKGIV